MAAKQTSALIPLCHPLPLSSVHVELTPTRARLRHRSARPHDGADRRRDGSAHRRGRRRADGLRHGEGGGQGDGDRRHPPRIQSRGKIGNVSKGGKGRKGGIDRMDASPVACPLAAVPGLSCLLVGASAQSPRDPACGFACSRLQLHDRPQLSARSGRLHRGPRVPRRISLRGHGSQRQIVDPEGQARDRRGAAEPRHQPRLLRRGHHDLEGRALPADLASRNRVRVRREDVRVQERSITGRGLGADARRRRA